MIHSENTIDSIYLCTQFVDFRRQINGLSIYVEAILELNPFDPVMFVFCNKRRTSIKILRWDKNGFCLWQKILNQEKFKWPKKLDSKTFTIDQQTLSWLLDGYDIQKMKPHKVLNFGTVF